MIAFLLGFIVRLKPNIKNKWLHIILGLIIGPPIAVCVAKIILAFLGECFVGNACFIPLCLLIILVIVKATVVRAVTGIRTSVSYSASLLIIIVTIVFSVSYMIVVDFGDPSCSFVILPMLFIVLGFTYRLLAGPNPLGVIYIGITLTVSLLIGLYLYDIYELFNPPYPSSGFGELLHFVPLILLIPLIEVWPASLFVPKGKVEKAVILSTIAVIIFMTNAYISTSIALSWLV